MVVKKRQAMLPRQLTTVTPFSKFIALIILILFPIIGFFLGRYYERSIYSTGKNASYEPTYSGDAILWKRYKNQKLGIQFQYPTTWSVSDHSNDYNFPALYVSKESSSIALLHKNNNDAKAFNVPILKKDNVAIGTYQVLVNYYTTSVTKQPAAYYYNSKGIGGLQNITLVNIQLNKQTQEDDMQTIKQILLTIRPLKH